MKPCTRWRCCGGHVWRIAAAIRMARPCGWWCRGSTDSRASNRWSKSGWWSSQPPTTWNITNSHEYGFYSNVNPQVDHPRWSQGNERRLGELRRRPTLMFNGYGDQVAQLYAGMDLKKNF